MTIIIFGATGTVGHQLVKQALYKGYKVKAFGRNVYSAKLPENENLELVTGALFDAAEVQRAVKGCDAVLSAIGGAIDGTDKTRSLGMKNIVAQMEAAGLKRIVAIGGTGILEDEEGKMLFEDEDYPQEYIPVTMEHKKAYEYLKASNLDWTLVCPPMIIAGEATGMFRTEATKQPEGNLKIKAGDLAMFMLNEMVNKEFLNERAGISNY